MTQAEIDAGMWSPVEQYACIDNALAHAEDVAPQQHLDQIAELWHRLNTVAVANPDAAFPTPRSTEFLRSAGPGNRPLAYPYAKWHSTQWAVDQAAALVLCSAALAEELGVAADRWVFPHVLAESSHSLSLSRRGELHRWPAMQVLGQAAAQRLGAPLSQVPHVELYSCFPSAVRVQQRELGLDPDGTPSITGGMAFAGGPFNNFTYQSTAAIVTRLREDPGSLGMTTTVSGLLTKPAIAVWSTDPAPDGEWVADLAGDAEAATASRTATAHHHGEGTVATWTVTYDGDEPRSAFVIADLDDDTRWVGTSSDAALLERALRDGVIGDRVRIDDTSCRPA
jgi:acetyl-CoA C-acetyltransferase